MLYYIVTNLNEVITTKQYIDSVLNDNVNGLFLCELPTGYGKTYTITNCMREYAANPNNTRKIIYLTTLNKNLPEEDLKEHIMMKNYTIKRYCEYVQILMKL